MKRFFIYLFLRKYYYSNVSLSEYSSTITDGAVSPHELGHVFCHDHSLILSPVSQLTNN